MAAAAAQCRHTLAAGALELAFRHPRRRRRSAAPWRPPRRSSRAMAPAPLEAAAAAAAARHSQQRQALRWEAARWRRQPRPRRPSLPLLPRRQPAVVWPQLRLLPARVPPAPPRWRLPRRLPLPPRWQLLLLRPRLLRTPRLLHPPHPLHRLRLLLARRRPHLPRLPSRRWTPGQQGGRLQKRRCRSTCLQVREYEWRWGWRTMLGCQLHAC